MRRDPQEMQLLIDESRQALITLASLKTRLELFTDQLVADLEADRQETDGGQHGGPDPGTTGQRG